MITAFGTDTRATTKPFASDWRSERASGGAAGDSRMSPGTYPLMESLLDRLAPCPWAAHAGLSAWSHEAPVSPSAALSQASLTRASKTAPLYTPEQRLRRDASAWTRVQAVLAPLQFLICAASLVLIVRYLSTGQGYALATGSILLKTFALYAIMITGSIWEKEVFGKWLFAPAFFWEDVFSMLVLALQTAYLVALLRGWGTPAQQMTIAVAAYAAYAVNASQFLLKLRAARLGAAGGRMPVATA